MDQTQGKTRLTSREIAKRLGCTVKAALHLLHAAGVEYEKCGSSYLWNAPDAERLFSLLAAAKTSTDLTVKKTPSTEPGA
jgi:hypothetical protein